MVSGDTYVEQLADAIAKGLLTPVGDPQVTTPVTTGKKHLAP